MKTSLSFFVVILMATIVFSCSEKENLDQIPQSITNQAIVSPDGIVLAKSQQALKKIIQKDVDRIAGESTEFEISFLNYFENQNLSAVEINFTTDTGVKSNVIYVKRRISNKNLDVEEKCYTASCSECSDCGVTTTDEGDGTFSYSCWEACCEMTIRETDCK